MILVVRNLGTADEDVLTRSNIGVFFLDLHFQYFGRMLNDLRNVRYVAGYMVST